MIVYTVTIPAEDEELWDERLAASEPATQVFTHLNPEWIVVEATFEEETSALILQAAFGGELAPLLAATHTDGWETLPAKIGHRFVVAEEPLESEKATVLTMEAPESVFDGPRHPSTLASLRLLLNLVDEERLPDKFTCLDVGCGSGILGIAAGLLGASRVQGIDLCPQAVQAARENAARYGLAERCRWEETDLGDFEGEEQDLVIANLFSDLLEKSFDRLGVWVAPQGLLIISGILERFQEKVLEAAQHSGFSIVETRQRGPWVTGLLKKV